MSQSCRWWNKLVYMHYLKSSNDILEKVRCTCHNVNVMHSSTCTENILGHYICVWVWYICRNESKRLCMYQGVKSDIVIDVFLNGHLKWNCHWCLEIYELSHRILIFILPVWSLLYLYCLLGRLPEALRSGWHRGHIPLPLPLKP